jgi:hypothetical protein
VAATTQAGKSQAEAYKAAGKSIAQAALDAAKQQSQTASKVGAASDATAKGDTNSLITAQGQVLSSWKELVVRGFVVMVGLVR